ncbi:MAG TPA: 16S rRNA (guanine(527)-N(7))-methyltransferase RsmG [Flavobacteriales bacterium]|nr:16S rRNA (guanine(527)-N(7))-methyltransferase RsmG [Flavobacteriales bacterium]HIN39263.1 16S rRNA (guanine(527)-N(7))-methyltransferase RsmG [Flavobacteriales bacterium]
MGLDYNLVTKYFPDISSLQLEQFKELGNLYLEWNSKINVISRKDLDFLYLHHILHSLGIAKLIQFHPKTEILDLGTGGGLPGIPLAIMFPKANFHLVDSIKKKIKVVESISSALALDNVNAEWIRAEALDKSYDFVIGRAVKDISVIHNWISKKIRSNSNHEIENGLIYLKGDAESDQKKYPSLQVYPLSSYFSEDFFETKLIIHLPIFFSLSQKNLN